MSDFEIWEFRDVGILRFLGSTIYFDHAFKQITKSAIPKSEISKRFLPGVHVWPRSFL